MRFIAEVLDKSDVVEFGFEDIGNVFPSDGVMYVKGVPILIDTIKLAQDVTSISIDAALQWLLLLQSYALALDDKQPTAVRLENLRRLRLAAQSPELAALIQTIQQEQPHAAP